MIYDIIGDIHGHADKLQALLRKLHYQVRDGIYHHNDRKAVFVGDFIDRGPQNQRVIEIVRGMTDNGHAYAVMGNHEYNAICYHTPESQGKFLRPHTESKSRQHENFLKEYPLGEADTANAIEWFKTLPLFLEFDHFRVIHACWDANKIDQAKPYLTADNTLKEEFYPESADKGTDLYHIIDRLLKGVEVELPAPCSFKDKDGRSRHHIRVKW
jgi:predicted MPP superfamily phosphohydrolase